LRDDTIAKLALQAMYEYWTTDGRNETSSAGVPLIEFAFCCVWSWDARPFPTFPLLGDEWGDAGNWQTGDWLNGRGAPLPPPPPSPSPGVGAFASFPSLTELRASMHVRPRFDTDVANHVSGRSSRRAKFLQPLFDFELTFDILRSDAANVELQQIAGFFDAMDGAATPFWFAPLDLAANLGQVLGTGDASSTTFPLVSAFGSTLVRVAGVSGVAAVYVNGVVQPSTVWTLTNAYPASIAFALPPALGAIVAADFSALWLCRFADDRLELEEFMTTLFALRTLNLQAVRP
jgi:uncharacterized protein (TIGR02217 family)